jgi:hypothetical protein
LRRRVECVSEIPVWLQSGRARVRVSRRTATKLTHQHAAAYQACSLSLLLAAHPDWFPRRASLASCSASYQAWACESTTTHSATALASEEAMKWAKHDQSHRARAFQADVCRSPAAAAKAVTVSGAGASQCAHPVPQEAGIISQRCFASVPPKIRHMEARAQRYSGCGLCNTVGRGR